MIMLITAGCSADVKTTLRTDQPAPVENAPASPLLPHTMDKWWLWTNGTQLRGANIYQRRVYIELDGIDFIGSKAVGPPYTQADFDALSAAGINYVNISAPGLFTVKPPYVLDEGVQKNLDSLLAMAEQADLFVVISARTGPGRSEFSILREGVGEWFQEDFLIERVWDDAEARAAWAEMWLYTAERYRSNPFVVGYDLMVEPNANEIVEIWEPEEFYAQYGGTGSDWNSWFPNIVNAIRTVDTETPILVAGMGYSALGWLPSTQVIDDKRTVYTFHQYEPFIYTHQDFGEIANAYPGYFDADWDQVKEDVNHDWLDNYFSIVDDFRDKYSVPVAVNECGIMRWVPGADNFMRDQWDLIEQRGLNYAVWMWYPAWEPMAEGDNSFNFHFGFNPENLSNVPNDLKALYQEFWARNTIRPSSFAK